MLVIMTCPTCGSDKIKRVHGTWIGEFQERSYSVRNLEYYECPHCGEKVYDREAMRKIEAHSPAFAKSAVQSHTRT